MECNVSVMNGGRQAREVTCAMLHDVRDVAFAAVSRSSTDDHAHVHVMSITADNYSIFRLRTGTASSVADRL